MAEIIYPLNEVDYNAEDAQLWNSGIARGVFGNADFTIEDIDGLTVNIGKGRAWLKPDDFTGFAYANKSNKTLTCSLADSIADRYDVIAIHWDSVTNSFDALRLTEGGSTIPEPTQSETTQELYLYAIRRQAGSTEITMADITDLRTNSTYCGLVASAFTEVDTSVINAKANELLGNLENAIDGIVTGSSTMLTNVYDPNSKGIDVTTQTYAHAFADGVHTLTGSGSNGRFKATADGTASEFVIDGDTYTVVQGDDSEIDIVTGKWYPFILDAEDATINFKPASGGLKLSVVGGTTPPSEPKPNTIWVNTSQTVSNFVISSTPPDVADGLVWIGVGGTDTVVTDKNIAIPVNAAYVAVDGGWKIQQSSIFDGSSWADMSLSICDGVKFKWNSNSGFGPHWGSGAFTSPIINSDYFSTITIHYTNSSMGSLNKCTAYFDTKTAEKFNVAPNETGSLSIDVSTVTGDFTVTLDATSGGAQGVNATREVTIDSIVLS